MSTLHKHPPSAHCLTGGRRGGGGLKEHDARDAMSVRHFAVAARHRGVQLCLAWHALQPSQRLAGGGSGDGGSSVQGTAPPLGDTPVVGILMYLG